MKLDLDVSSIITNTPSNEEYMLENMDDWNQDTEYLLSLLLTVQGCKIGQKLMLGACIYCPPNTFKLTEAISG